MADYDCITFHTAACDDHFDRLLNVHGPEGLDDVCPLCEIERLKRCRKRDLAYLHAELKQANAVVDAAREWQANCKTFGLLPDAKLQEALAALRAAVKGADDG